MSLLRGHQKFQLKEKLLATAVPDLDLQSFDWLLITSDVVFDLLTQVTDLKRHSQFGGGRTSEYGKSNNPDIR